MSARPGRRASSAVVAAAALLVLLPVGAVGVGVLTAGGAPWSRVADSGWVPLLGTTLALLGLTLVGATVLALWVDVKVSAGAGGQLLHNLSLLFWWGAAGWLVWRVLNWRRDWFVATDKRFLLFFGFIRRKVAMMPLLKVTDMTYDRSLLERASTGRRLVRSRGGCHCGTARLGRPARPASARPCSPPGAQGRCSRRSSIERSAARVECLPQGI